jgi:hypothetical protein
MVGISVPGETIAMDTNVISQGQVSSPTSPLIGSIKQSPNVAEVVQLLPPNIKQPPETMV